MGGLHVVCEEREGLGGGMRDVFVERGGGGCTKYRMGGGVQFWGGGCNFWEIVIC